MQASCGGPPQATARNRASSISEEQRALEGVVRSAGFSAAVLAAWRRRGRVAFDVRTRERITEKARELGVELAPGIMDNLKQLGASE